MAGAYEQRGRVLQSWYRTVVTWATVGMTASHGLEEGIDMSFSIDQFVADCVGAMGDGHDGLAVRDVVERAVSDPAMMESALGDPADQPLFSTWHRSSELTVLNIIWPPEVDLWPHDHLIWAVIGLYGGREHNSFFRELPDGGLERRRTATLEPRDTVVLGDDTIHAVSNPTRQWTGAIHVYGGDFFRDDRRSWAHDGTGVRPFDPDEVRELLSGAAARAVAPGD